MAKLDLTVKLIGKDGNIFNLMAIVIEEMRKNKYREEINEFRKDIMSSESYDEALRKIVKWVNVE